LCALFGYQRQGRTKEEDKEEEEDEEGEDPTRFRILLKSKEADDLSFSSRAKKKTDKIHLSLSLSLSLLYPSRDKICGLVLFFLEKLFSPLKRTFAVGNLRRDDGGSLLLVGDNFGDDLGAGDLGL
jgi:hypothetical protein